MLGIVTPVCLVLILAACLLAVLRLFKGPSLPDRILALDTLYINAIALIVLYGISSKSNIVFEVAMLIALIGFVGTVALAKNLLRGDIIE